MRVVHLHRLRGISGSERHLLTLLPALAERGVDACFIGLDDPGGDNEPFYFELRAAGIPFTRVKASRDLDPFLARRVVRAVRRFRPSIVHTHLAHGDVYGAIAAVATGATLVSTKHNDDPFRAGAFRFVERALTRRAQRVIAITDALARFNVDRVGLPAEKLTVVHYGLDHGPSGDGEQLRGTGLPAGARVVVAVGRLVDQKGHEVAVRALLRLRRRHPEAVLVVLGEGPLRGNLEQLADELGIGASVILPGNVQDVGAWFARANVFVHPARWEGFGLVLLEAMLAGLPVVATRVSSIPEIVADEETGLLVPPEDEAALTEALDRMLADPAAAARMGERGRERAREEFSARRMVDGTLAVYEAALARRAATATMPSAQESTE